MKKTIAVIYGGEGLEHDVSVMGYRNLSGLINREKYDLYEIFIDRSGAWYFIRADESYPTFPVKLGDKSGFLVGGRIICCDVAFPLLHGDMGEDGNIQGLLRAAEIPFVGEDARVGAICSDKDATKRIAESLGISVAEGITLVDATLDEALTRVRETLSYPLFVKPATLGSSFGASAVFSEEELVIAYKRAKELDRRVLIERLVSPKRELECAVLGVRSGFVITAPGEIIISGSYGYNEKYKQPTRLSVRADIPDGVARKIADASSRLVFGLGIRSMSRIDFFLSGDKLILNEINTMPGLTGGSLYLKMLAEHGIAPEMAIDTLIDSALERAV